MDATGYCNTNTALSDWDHFSVSRAYGDVYPSDQDAVAYVNATRYYDHTASQERIYAFPKVPGTALRINSWDGTQWAWSTASNPAPGVTVTGSVTSYWVKDNASTAPRPYSFVRGSDNHLWAYYFTGTQWSWSDQGTPSGTTVGASPSGVAYMGDDAATRHYVFAVGANGNLYIRFYGSGWSWVSQGAPSGATLTGQPTILTHLTESGVRKVYAFVRATDGNLYVNYWDGSVWSWASLGAPTGHTLSADPSATSYVDSAGTRHMYVFAPAQNILYTLHWDGTAWTGDSGSVPSGTTVANVRPASASFVHSDGSRRIYAFVATSNGHAYFRYFDGTTWSWSDQGTPPGTTVAAEHTLTTTYTDSSDTRRVYVFYKTANSHLYARWYDGSSWSWRDQGTL